MTERHARGLLWCIGAVPVLVALLAIPLNSWREPATALNNLGRLSGIGGLSLFLVAAAVSFRIPGFDQVFGGLIRLWRTHHQLGAVAFLLLLIHPLLLSLAAVNISLEAAIAVLFPLGSGLAIWLGWGALLLTMVFLAPSFAFFGEPDYQRWKNVHRLSGLAALLALGHTFVLARTIPPPWGSLIWMTLSLAALVALAYGLVFARRANQYSYTVSGVEHPANNVVEIALAPDSHHLRYHPGQFVYLRPYDRELAAGVGEEHPYTLTSPPGEAGLRVAIKDLGDASRALQSVRSGTKMRVMGPYGSFFAPCDGSGELWLAGGIGITPFLSRARDLVARGVGGDIHLIYCVQDEARSLFADELRALEAAITGFRLTLHYFYSEGPLSVEFLQSHCPDFVERCIYTCGPTPFMQLVMAIAGRNGVPVGRIHSEEFNLL